MCLFPTNYSYTDALSKTNIHNLLFSDTKKKKTHTHHTVVSSNMWGGILTNTHMNTIDIGRDGS